MRWGWLLPDASCEVLYDGWERQSYHPRHGKSPFVMRGAYSVAMALWRARERYLGAVEDESLAGAGAAAAGSRAAAGVRAVTGSAGARGAGLGAVARVGITAGARAAAGVGTAGGVGAAGVSAKARRPRRAD